MKRRQAQSGNRFSDDWNLNVRESSRMSDILPQTITTDRKSKKSQHDPHLISWQWVIVILAIGCLLFYLIHLIDHTLPRIVSEDEALKNPDLFSSERSRTILRKLTNLGPRVVGDVANEVHAPLIIENEASKIKSEAHPLQSISIQRQKGSGAYYLGFKLGFTNVYDNIQNVLVKLEGSEGNHSILMNCHYDSVPASPGASDDGITCAVMLELLRVLSSSDKRLKHNVIFLFNGAEETPLQAAHLFLQHNWSKTCRIVLNLEAAGQGGKAMLFQSGPKNSWLFEYYSKNAPHPHAQVLTEELFQSGFIPSDTDFRVFRDYGKMAGLDFAFGRNGYVYHTIYDTEEYIPLGSHQHLGDNLLVLLKELGNASELQDMTTDTGDEMVFYDYLGWFMISYSTNFGIGMNIFAILLAISSIVVLFRRLLCLSPFQISKFADETAITIRSSQRANEELDDTQLEIEESELKHVSECKEHGHNLNTSSVILKELSIAVIACISGQLLSIAIVVVISMFIDSVAKLAMPWYSNVWIIFPIYWCPCLITYATVPYLFDQWRLKKRRLLPVTLTHFNLIAAQIPWVFLLFVFTCLGIRSSSLFLLPVLSSAIANLLIHLTPLCKTIHKWVFVYILVHLPSLFFSMYIVLLIYVLLIPISGRSGAINGDLYVGVVTALLMIYMISFLIPIMGLVKQRVVILIILSCFSVIMIIVSLTTSVGFPYKAGPNSPAPQRYWVMHTQREFYNESQLLRRNETGYFLLNMDRNSPRTVPHIQRSNVKSLKLDCEEELLCGLPFYMTRMILLGPTSVWIPAGAPYIPNKTELKLIGRSTENTNDLTCRIELSLKGPDRMTLLFSPRNGAELKAWNIPSPAIPTGTWKSRPYYYIHIVRGEITGDYNITLEFNITLEQKSGKPIIDIGLAGNHAHHESNRTKEFQNFINSFPEWTTMMGWISVYKKYVF